MSNVNPFTLSFGSTPTQYLPRLDETQSIYERIAAPTSLSHCFVITGVRGAGKTVLLTSVAKRFGEDDSWIVVELNPEDDMREALAAKLYSLCKIKHLFLEKNFSFSFHGLTFSIAGKNPILNIDDLLDRMLSEINRQGKKVLVLIDEASNNEYMKRFALSFQILIRHDYPLFLVMTSLYENISGLENEQNMTFLIRAPRIYISSLNINSIAASYQETMGLSQAESFRYARMTKGYAFAFQLLGYLLFEGKKNNESERTILAKLDQYLEEFVYRKIWPSLTPVERAILYALPDESAVTVKTIMENAKMKKESFSKYRDRLIKKGVLVCPSRGKLAFALPRFRHFLDTRFDY